MRPIKTLHLPFPRFFEPNKPLSALRRRPRPGFDNTCWAFLKDEGLFLTPSLLEHYPTHLQVEKARKGPIFRPPPFFYGRGSPSSLCALSILRGFPICEPKGPCVLPENDGQLGKAGSCKGKRMPRRNQPIMRSVLASEAGPRLFPRPVSLRPYTTERSRVHRPEVKEVEVQ